VQIFPLVTLIYDIDYLWSVVPATALAGSDGGATLTLYEGRTYYLTSYISSPNGTQQRCAGPLKFIASEGLRLDAITIEHVGNCLAQLSPLFRPPLK
jgi:hypothetical protein